MSLPKQIKMVALPPGAVVWTGLEDFHDQSQGPSVAPSEPQGNLLKPQPQGHSKAPSSVIAPVLPPVAIASSSVAVLHAPMDLPMPDLHLMVMAIWDSANHIAALKTWVVNQCYADVSQGPGSRCMHVKGL
ncbi:uncharacterized protein EDB91DRAFT_1088191 [Suillus paluster]|uniref:uncharacterized protein n=1 Tax=Suillus paluster TaxID=48578 RepID=UPI001B86C866|nr:uncharacterized protein EDB91DRAFT_1088191 [Suillus paluster]KAG1722283.1 hypothetical protein EDB91DRAFT_1088191 [Suillus paluster]